MCNCFATPTMVGGGGVVHGDNHHTLLSLLCESSDKIHENLDHLRSKTRKWTMTFKVLMMAITFLKPPLSMHICLQACGPLHKPSQQHGGKSFLISHWSLRLKKWHYSCVLTVKDVTRMGEAPKHPTLSCKFFKRHWLRLQPEHLQ